jgi:hypothetical protein
MRPPACGGGELKAAEDEEEAFFTARVAAFWHSPEGRDRTRMRELEFKGIGSRCRTLDEQKELDQLTLLYPEPTRESELATAIAELRKKRAPRTANNSELFNPSAKRFTYVIGHRLLAMPTGSMVCSARATG